MTAGILGSVVTDVDNSVSHNLLLGYNRWVIAVVATEKGGEGSISGCTYGGTAMTELGKIEIDTGTFENWIAIFGIKEADLPNDGINACVVTASYTAIIIQVFSIKDASQNSPVVTDLVDTNNTIISKTITTIADYSLVISGVVGSNNDKNWTHGTGQTELADRDSGDHIASSSWEVVASAGLETQTHTASGTASARLAMINVSFESASMYRVKMFGRNF